MLGQCAVGLFAFVLHDANLFFSFFQCLFNRLDQVFDGLTFLVQFAFGLGLKLFEILLGEFEKFFVIVF